MISSDLYKYVYIAIPKTGSGSMRQFLRDHYSGAVIGRYHSIDVPEKLKDFFRFTMVRNPYERCFSRWMYEKHKKDHNRRVPSNIGFIDFMDWLSQHKYSDPMPNSLPHLNMSQKEYYEKAGCEYYVRLENQQEDFSCLPFVKSGDPVELPILRTTKNKPSVPFEEYFSHNLKQAKMSVRELYEEDFDYFDYEV